MFIREDSGGKQMVPNLGRAALTQTQTFDSTAEPRQKSSQPRLAQDQRLLYRWQLEEVLGIQQYVN